MIFFLLSVLTTVALYVIMRAFSLVGIDRFQAIVWNYFACVATGWALVENKAALSQLDFSSPRVLYSIALGCTFVVTFNLMGITAQKVSVTAVSLASNMSLIIPVAFGLWVFNTVNKVFTTLNYAGLLLALLALALSVIAPTQEKKTTNSWLTLLPVVVFLMSGLTNTTINYISMSYYESNEASLFMIIACLGACATGVLLLGIRLLMGLSVFQPKAILGGIVLGVPNFLSLFFLLKTLDAFGNSAAFVFPIYNMLVVLVSALAGYILYKEKLLTINKIGFALALLAIFLISYQELLPVIFK